MKKEQYLRRGDVVSAIDLERYDYAVLAEMPSGSLVTNVSPMKGHLSHAKKNGREWNYSCVCVIANDFPVLVVLA